MTEEQIKQMNSLKWFHNIVLPGGNTTPGVCPHTASEATSRFGMPDTLKGKRVLDIGCYDGLFSFEAEKRGAKSVLAIDLYQLPQNTENPNAPFRFAQQILKSNVEFKEFDATNINSYNIGQFDVVLCYGVLYHLKNPTQTLEAICSAIAPSGKLIIETAIMNEQNKEPLLTHSPNHANDPNNHFYPNTTWLQRELKRLKFNNSYIIYNDGSRATIRGEK